MYYYRIFSILEKWKGCTNVALNLLGNKLKNFIINNHRLTELDVIKIDLIAIVINNCINLLRFRIRFFHWFF